MDFGRAFTFVKDDPSWVSKIAVGAAISLVSALLLGLPAAVLLGYQIQVMRNVRDGKDLPLPEWADFGKLFMDGLRILVAIFVYTLPLWILFCIGFVVMLLPALSGDNSDVAGALAGITVTVWCVMSCLAILVLLGLALVVPAINLQYVRTNQFGSLFRIGEVMGIVRENIGDILMTVVANIAAQFVLQLVTSIVAITICGPFIVSLGGSVWILISMAHLYGQIAAKSGGKLAGAYAG